MGQSRPNGPRPARELLFQRAQVGLMHFVYILKSLKDNNLYTGCTCNLKKRIKAHNSGKVQSTQKRKPFHVVFFEEYETSIEARRRENFLKTYEGGKLKRQLIASFPKDQLLQFKDAEPSTN